MYKLIICDLDDTLLDPMKQLPVGFDNFRQTLDERGIKFTLATGRSNQSVQPFIDALNIDLPYASSNGAVIMQKGQKIHCFKMALGPLRPLIEIAQSMGISVIYVVDGVEYAANLTDFIQKPNPANLSTQIYRPIVARDWQELKVDKVFLADPNSGVGLSRLYALANNLGPHYHYHCFEDWAMDIVSRQVDKGNALKWIAQYLQLAPQEVLAVGDGENDLPMIQAAGHGFAVANAILELQLQADSIAKAAYGQGVIEECLRLIQA